MSNVKLLILSDDHLQGAVDVLRHSFFPDEKVCNCVKILEDSPHLEVGSSYKCTQGTLQLENLAVDAAAKDGVSIVAVDSQDESHVVGVVFNKIQVKPQDGQLSYFERYAEDNITDESAKALVKFMIDADSKKDLFEHFNADCALEIMFLGVKSTHKGLGIGQALIEQSIKVAKEITGPPKPKIATALFSSRFSQKAGLRAGMKTVLEIPYTEFSYKGQKYSEVTGLEHPSCTLSAIQLTS